MARRFNTPLAPFNCTSCGVILGYTAPGEATRIGYRAHLFCERCRDTPAAMTDKQEALLTALREISNSGQKPTITAAAEYMKISRSRAQQIAIAIRSRGYGAELDQALQWDRDGKTVPGSIAGHLLPEGYIRPDSVTPPAKQEAPDFTEEPEPIVDLSGFNLNLPPTTNNPTPEPVATPVPIGMAPNNPSNPEDDPARGAVDFIV